MKKIIYILPLLFFAQIISAQDKQQGTLSTIKVQGGVGNSDAIDSLKNNAGVLEARKKGVFVPQFTLPSGGGITLPQLQDSLNGKQDTGVVTKIGLVKPLRPTSDSMGIRFDSLNLTELRYSLADRDTTTWTGQTLIDEDYLNDRLISAPISTAVQTALNLKFNLTDTAATLFPYARKNKVAYDSSVLATAINLRALDANVVHLSGTESISGSKTYTAATIFNTSSGITTVSGTGVGANRASGAYFGNTGGVVIFYGTSLSFRAADAVTEYINVNSTNTQFSTPIVLKSLAVGLSTDSILVQNGRTVKQIASASLVIPPKVDTVTTISVLYNLITTANTVIVTDSLRGGTFHRISAATPDSMTIFKSVSGGYWQRQFIKGQYHFHWSGADPTGVTDITALLNYILLTIPKYSTLDLDIGIYRNTGISLTRSVNIIGAGRSASTLYNVGTNPTLYIHGVSNAFFKYFSTQGNGGSFGAGATNGDAIKIDNSTLLSFDNLLISQNGGYGIIADSTVGYNMLFSNCIIQNNNAGGVRMIGRSGSFQINAITFSVCQVLNNYGNNFELNGVSISLLNNDIGVTPQRGILIYNNNGDPNYGSYNISIHNNYFEQCDSGFILILKKPRMYMTGISIQNNYGKYDTSSSAQTIHPINYSGINLTEIKCDSAVDLYPINSFNFSNNNFYGGNGNTGSVLNGNNLLPVSAIITPDYRSGGSPYINLGNAMILAGGIYAPKGASAQTTLVAGTKSINVPGVTASSTATLGFVSIGGTVTTTWQYAVVCTTDTVTITALTNAGATNTSDTSILNYSVVY